jgi:hypothetical protein
LASSDLRESLGKVASGPGEERLGDRLGAPLTFTSPTVGRCAGDGFLDPAELADAVEGLLGDRRAGRGMHVKEFAPDMRPTGSLGDPIASE